MVKVTSLFFITLFLCYNILSLAARPQPLLLTDSSPKTHRLDVETEHAVIVDESCEGVGEEECLTRRTLAAHLDYIYTQNHNP